MNYSKQRETIAHFVLNSCNHPTADMVYENIRQELPQISLGTVYRNLNTLSEKGIIKKISMPNHCDRFDNTKHEHFHIYCVKCNKLDDIDYKINDDIYERIEKKYKILSCNLVFEGICNDCMEGNE